MQKIKADIKYHEDGEKALVTSVTDKINILQDTFVVNSEDGGDREVEINNYHFEEGKINDGVTSYHSEHTVESGSPTGEEYTTSQISHIYYRFELLKKSNDASWSMIGKFVDSSSWLGLGNGNNIVRFYDGVNIHNGSLTKPMTNTIFDVHIIVDKSNKEVTYEVSHEGEVVLNVKTVINIVDKFKIMFGNSNPQIPQAVIYGSFICSRVLTPKEVNHTFNVISNSKDIRILDDKTIILDREECTEIETLSTQAQEECKLLSGVIEGATVKNFLGESLAKDAYWEGDTNTVNYRRYLITGVQNTVKYTFKAIWNGIIENLTRDARFILEYYSEIQSKWVAIKEFNQGNITDFNLTFTLPSDCTHLRFNVYGLGGRGSCDILKYYPHPMILEGDWTNTDISIGLGLNSTEATIEVDDIKHSIYDPIIRGETKVMKNGVEVEPQVGATLVSLSSTDSSLPKLGSTPTVSDTIDMRSGICTLNTKEVSLGSLSNGVVESFDGVKRFRFLTDLFSDANLSSQNTDGNGFSNIAKVKSGDIKNTENDYIRIISSRLYYYVHPSDTRTLEEITQLVRGGLVRYQLATPVTQQLTSQQMDTYNQHKKAIELSKVGDIADELILNEDGSGTWIKRLGSGVFTGDEWAYYDSPTATTTRGIVWNAEGVMVGMPNTPLSISDRFEHVRGGTKDPNKYYFSNKNILLTLEETSIERFKNNLNQNNFNIIYQLANPITTHVPPHLMPQIILE
ncbi:MAG: hypothetical protein ACRC1P_10950 [Cellulosilyticaceae bacterium]